jgi:methylmalonyl-CoA mutase cobalamin-binding subunit
VTTFSSGVQDGDGAQAALLREHDLTVAALCPGKDAAEEDQASLVSALRAAGAERVYVAGARQEAAASIGADVGVRDGVDMVAVLGELLDHFESERDRP